MHNPFKGFVHRSFLERNPIVIGIVGILFVAAGSAFALLLSGGIFKDTYTVTAAFTDAAGLRPGDEVTVAGVEAGSVGDITIAGDHVEVALEIDSGIEMPDDSSAEIIVETLLGTKSVDLVAGRSDRDFGDGDDISITATTTPVDVTDLNDASVTLLEGSDARALERLMEEVTAITKGKSQQLRVVIDGLADVTEALDSKRDELARLIDSLDKVARAFAQKDQTIISLIDRYNVVLGNLADRRDDLVTLLVNTDEASHEVASLVDRNRPALDNTLRDLHTALEVVNDHQLDLAASIPYLETSVRGYSSVGYSQGVPNRWANIFVQSLGPVGIDAIVGPCGLIDEAFDEFLGEDPRSCEERAQSSEDPPAPGSGDPSPGAPVTEPPDEQSGSGSPEAPGGGDLGGDIGDLFDSATGGVLGGGG